MVLGDPVINELHTSGAFIYDPDTLPVVFRDLPEDSFGEVEFAIEPRSSMYDDEDERESDEENDEDDNPF